MRNIRSQVTFKENCMAHWLYRYVFRGIGIVVLAGILTGLFLVVNQFRRMANPPVTPNVTTGVRR